MSEYAQPASTTLDQPEVIPCLVCGAMLKPAMRGERTPYGGTVFNSHGNYGSMLFDPAGVHDTRFLRIHICDSCLERAAMSGRVEHGSPVYQPSVTIYRQWTPDVEEELNP